MNTCNIKWQNILTLKDVATQEMNTADHNQTDAVH